MKTPKEKKSIKGTQTEKNLAVAYMAESQAYARYTFYAQTAHKESYFPVEECSMDHAILTGTADNLKAAIWEEKNEGVNAYKQFAEVAVEEGFPEIASHFEAIAEIEQHHMERFEAWLKHVENGTVWKRTKKIKWQCLVCGYIYEGKEPLKECPACDHPYQHYMALDIE